MKKAIVFALVAGFGIGLVLALASPVSARPVAECYDNFDVCRARALSNDMGVLKTALALTLCDVALGRCIFLA